MAVLHVCLGVLLLVLCSAENRRHVTDTLFNSLMEHYISSNSRYTKPPGLENGTLRVNVSMFLLDVVHVNPSTGEVVFVMFPSFSWVDSRLQWDASIFENTTKLYVPHDMIWRPDIVPYRGTTTDGLKEYNAVVFSSGTVALNPKWNVQKRCSLVHELRSLVCKLEIGSWTYDASQLSLRLGQDDMDITFFDQGNWEVVSAAAKRVEKVYDCCDEPYVSLVYNITLRFARS